MKRALLLMLTLHAPLAAQTAPNAAKDAGNPNRTARYQSWVEFNRTSRTDWQQVRRVERRLKRLGTAEALYQAALAAEKGGGDRDSAVVLYRQIVNLSKAGKASRPLVARTEERLARLGAAPSEEARANLPFQALGAQLGLRREQRLGEGRTGLQSGLFFRPRRAESTATEPAPHPMDPLPILERQIRALRYALGITGLLEYVEAMAANRGRARAPAPHELYLAGLYAEREREDGDRAASLYERALATAPPGLADRIRIRLAPLQKDQGR